MTDETPQWVETTVGFEDALGPYPARISGRSAGKNGYVVPYFTREVAERVARDLNAAHQADPYDGMQLTWDGVKLIHDERQYHDLDNYEPEICEPDADGYYTIGGGRWLWEEIFNPHKAIAVMRNASEALQELFASNKPDTMTLIACHKLDLVETFTELDEWLSGKGKGILPKDWA
jgi:hypothetical protein